MAYESIPYPPQYDDIPDTQEMQLVMNNGEEDIDVRVMVTFDDGTPTEIIGLDEHEYPIKECKDFLFPPF